MEGDILVYGAVANPGYHTYTGTDSVRQLIDYAGGATDDTTTTLELYVTEAGATAQAQKVNINLADAWLLDALPGIGPTKAQAIVDYRRHNGPFRSLDELHKVDGIGDAIFEEILPFITLAE
jgi:competence protein ComEA